MEETLDRVPADFIDFGRDLCCRMPGNARREWLVTNGLGGYASGTIGGTLSRRYHGLLVAATRPPTQRRLLLARLDEVLLRNGVSTELGANLWEGGVVEPSGFIHLERFRLVGSIPTWTYAVGPVRLRKQLFMIHGRNATVVRYELLQSPEPVRLRLKALVNHRGHHQVTGGHPFEAAVRPQPHGAMLELPAIGDLGPIELHFAAERGSFEPAGVWFDRFLLPVEWSRGYDHLENHCHALDVVLDLAPGEAASVAAGTEAFGRLDGAALLAEELDREAAILERAGARRSPPPIQHLVLAADQFMVRRRDGDRPDGVSVIAGYPWFSDWGRDTMLSLPGLCLATGRHGEAREILRTFARHLDAGLLPNRFPDEGEAPEFNSVDASLLYVEAIRAYLAASDDEPLLRELWPAVVQILEAYRDGTRHGIRMDPADSLVTAGEEGVQLTWMDAKIGDWVVTPRMGKPIEINALWFAALRSAAEFAKRLGEDGKAWRRLADRVESSFARFWNPQAGCCFDLLDGPDGDDPSIRPNQLIAASLHWCPLPREQRERVVEVAMERLWTSLGVRTLDPADPNYEGLYRGNQRLRDAAYHQGTSWPWLMGPLLSAHFALHRDREFVLAALRPFLDHLKDAGLGSISEVVDGDAPHEPGGCIAQAWSVATTLELWQTMQGASGKTKRGRPPRTAAGSR